MLDNNSKPQNVVLRDSECIDLSSFVTKTDNMHYLVFLLKIPKDVTYLTKYDWHDPHWSGAIDISELLTGAG